MTDDIDDNCTHNCSCCATPQIADAVRRLTEDG